MIYSEVIQQIKNKKFHPIYFLEGEETFFIDNITRLLENKVLLEHEKSFNQTIFYGRDTDAGSLINACRRFPMGSDYQLVILKEAQSMSKLEAIMPYIQNPLKSTILVIDYKYGKLDRRTLFSKAILKTALHFESKKLYDDKVPSWIIDYVREMGYNMDAKAASLLTDYLGNDLGKIVGELEKLFVGLEKGKGISSEKIASSIGISREYNVFELGTALGSRQYEKIYKIIFYFNANPKENPLVVVIGFLGSYFSKVLSFHYLKGQDRSSIASKLGVNPYFLGNYEMAAKNFPLNTIPNILSNIRIADAASKGVDIGPNTEPADILKELIYKILHA